MPRKRPTPTAIGTTPALSTTDIVLDYYLSADLGHLALFHEFCASILRRRLASAGPMSQPPGAPALPVQLPAAPPAPMPLPARRRRRNRTGLPAAPELSAPDTYGEVSEVADTEVVS